MTPNQVGGQERHIADAAADIEDMHAAGNTRAPKQVFGEGIEDCALKRQPAALPVVVAHGVLCGSSRHGRDYKLRQRLLPVSWVHTLLVSVVERTEPCDFRRFF